MLLVIFANINYAMGRTNGFGHAFNDIAKDNGYIIITIIFVIITTINIIIYQLYCIIGECKGIKNHTKYGHVEGKHVNEMFEDEEIEEMNVENIPCDEYNNGYI